MYTVGLCKYRRSDLLWSPAIAEIHVDTHVGRVGSTGIIGVMLRGTQKISYHSYRGIALKHSAHSRQGLFYNEGASGQAVPTGSFSLARS